MNRQKLIIFQSGIKSGETKKIFIRFSSEVYIIGKVKLNKVISDFHYIYIYIYIYIILKDSQNHTHYIYIVEYKCEWQKTHFSRQ